MKNFKFILLSLLAFSLYSTAHAQLFYEGPLTDTQLRASAITVTGQFYPSTQSVSITAMSALTNSSALIGRVTVVAAPSTEVTNTGIFATQATLAAETTKVIGAVNQNGTWTVQPGNTPNTTPWLATIHDGTTKVSVTAANISATALSSGLVVSSSPNGGNPCINPSADLRSITGATSGTAAVQIIPLSGTAKTYLCSNIVAGVSGTSPTFSLVYGTASNCATGQTILQQAISTVGTTLYNLGGGYVVPAGKAVCYLNTGTLPIHKYFISYVQQ